MATMPHSLPVQRHQEAPGYLYLPWTLFEAPLIIQLWFLELQRMMNVSSFIIILDLGYLWISHVFSHSYMNSNKIIYISSLSGHGSSLSLVSSSSSLYSSQEEKQAAEIRKLRKELAEAQEKVGTLSNQLSTNVSCHFE